MTTKQVWRRRISRLLMKLKWMLITLIVPEYILGKAYSDRRSAILHNKDFQELAEEDGVEWSVAHTFLANMGGFAIDFEQLPDACWRPAHSRDWPSTQSSHCGNISSHSVAHYEAAEADKLGITCSPRVEAESGAVGDTARDRDMSSAPKQENWLLQEQDTRCTERASSVPPSISEVAKDSLHNRFSSLASDQRYGTASWIERQLADCASLGNSVWTLNSRNSITVDVVLQGPHLEYLDEAWEQRAYNVENFAWYFNLAPLRGNIWILDACQLLYARKIGIIDRLPVITSDQVDDRNKGDLVVKGIVVAQVAWFIIQLVARVASNLPSSQLEIVVLAMSACSFVTYLLLVDKPQDIRTVIYTSASRPPQPTDVARVAIRGSHHTIWTRKQYWMPNNSMPCNGTRGRKWNNVRSLSASFFAAILFGGIHCAAWNLRFPTAAERLLWRATALATTTGPPIAAAVSMAFALLPRQSAVTKLIPTIFFRMLCVLYAIARIYLTVEVFRSLAYEDPLTFRTTWSANWPHFR
ncbi:hypothetical protein LTR95_003194 [Oleoguttula sp. CCFEE 5521]